MVGHGCCQKLKQGIDQSRIFWSFFGPQSSKLNDFGGIGKLIQRDTSAISVFIIEKISVKVGAKTKQG